MHLLVLSAFRHAGDVPVEKLLGKSQCTFWCSVLSDQYAPLGLVAENGLNAPFGAQCFPTIYPVFHRYELDVSQCTFWCSVLSDRNENG